MKHFPNPSRFFLTNQSKDNGPAINPSKLFTILIDHMQNGIWTNQKLALQTGAKITTICRYRRDLELSGVVKILFRAKDPVTGYPADFYTASKSIISSFQLQKDEKR